MIKIQDIYEGVHGSGPGKGTPCVAVIFAEEQDKKANIMTFNEVVVEIKKAGLKEVCLVGNVSLAEGLQELAVGLSKTGHHVVVLTNSSDNIETLRMLRNISFYIHIQPRQGKEINLRTFPLLKEGDCVILPVNTIKGYEGFAALLDSRLISRPELVFEIAKDSSQYEDVKDRVIQDSKKRIALTRIYSI